MSIEAASRPLRILLIDDYAEAALAMAILLRVYGHEVEIAADTHAAVVATVARPPHLVLLDLGPSGMDGFEVARQLLLVSGGRHKRAFLVALTDYADEENRGRCVAAGIDFHFTKPIDPKLLRHFLAQMRRMLVA